MKLIDDIKGAMELEVRTTSDAHEYFEAVFEAKDLDALSSLVKNTLGEPLKPPGKDMRLPRKVQELLDQMGGIRREQSFYLKEEETGEYVYVALWPWQSDPSKITLKLGKGKFSHSK